MKKFPFGPYLLLIWAGAVTVACAMAMNPMLWMGFGLSGTIPVALLSLQIIRKPARVED